MEIFLSRDNEKHRIELAIHDPKAFGELFEEHYDSILRYCIYHTGHVETARDIAAETFYKALKNLWRYRFTGAPFSAWLYRIAGNEVIDYFRKKKHRYISLTETMEREELLSFESRRNLQDEMDALQQKLENNKTYQRIRQVMENMPDHYRNVLVLRFVEEKKISEICEILGKKEGTIKSLISRGLTQLREITEKNILLHAEPVVYTDHTSPEGSLF
jgi:RNA polymerase sigma-70 factor (ECF subfamily)